MKKKILVLITALMTSLPMLANVMCGMTHYDGFELGEIIGIYENGCYLKFRITWEYNVFLVKVESKKSNKIIIPNEVEYRGKSFSVSDISPAAFDSCKNISEITIDPNNRYYSSIGSVLFNKDKTKIIFVPKTTKGSFTIPTSVTDIGDAAFRNCRELTNITIPYGATKIGYEAFNGCTSLTKIELPQTINSISDKAFANCTGLTSIELPNGITYISEKTFEGCTNLTNIRIPETVTHLYESAFANCTGLTSIELPKGIKDIRKNTFEGCTNLTNIELPETINYLDDSVFCNCNLETITIPANVNYIHARAFIGCKNLKSINVDPQNQWFSSQDGVLYNKDKTTILYVPEGKEGNFMIPSTVTTIGDLAFNQCDKLTNITIPKSVTEIGDKAFSNCTGLKKIKIPKSVIKFGMLVFSRCTNLDVVVDNPIYKVRKGKFAFNKCKSVKWKK